VKQAFDELEAEEHKPGKKKEVVKQIVSPMFVMTPALARMAKEYADEMIANKKEWKAQYKLERDEKLKALGLENCDEYYVQKLAEVKAIAGEIEEDVVNEAQMVLEFQGTSEAGASGSVPIAAASESISEDDNSDKVTQIPKPVIPISPSSSSSTDSDDKTIDTLRKTTPKGLSSSTKPHKKPVKHVTPKKSIGARVGSSSSIPTENTSLIDDLENHYKGELPGVTLHKATKSTSKKVGLVKQQKSTRLQPLQEVQSSAAVENTKDPEEPSFSDLPNHEITTTQQKTIPESADKTVVEESVQVTESEPSVFIPYSEQVQNLILNDSEQPSSSSPQIQILEQTTYKHSGI